MENYQKMTLMIMW